MAESKRGKINRRRFLKASALGVAGADLCRRVADVLIRFTEHRMRADVALVDFTGRELVASSGRWAA